MSCSIPILRYFNKATGSAKYISKGIFDVNWINIVTTPVGWFRVQS